MVSAAQIETFTLRSPRRDQTRRVRGLAAGRLTDGAFAGGRIAPNALGARRPLEYQSQSGRRGKEDQRAHLDAFPRRCAGDQRVVEGGVER